MSLALLPPVLSTLFRLFAYIFLQIIPTRLAIPVLPLLHLGYLSALYLSLSTAPEPHDPDAKKSQPKDTDPSPLAAVLLGLRTRDRLPNVLNVLINTGLLLASLDLALNPVLFPEQDVTFTRVGAVYPDAAKIMLRYPLVNETEHEVQILYREVTQSVAPWKDGPFITLSKDNDWVNATRLGSLWPDTKYEYIFSSADGILLPYPRAPIHFQTFPDPRLDSGSHFKFIVSSCITPNFPYKGPLARNNIQGFDLLSQSLTPPPAPIASVLGAETNETDSSASNETESITPAPVTSIFPKFMLFLGDFIYADVPVYFGDDEDAYLRLYRRTYASPSYRKIYEHLPMLHAYDDHEIINNYGGSGLDPSPYPVAVNAFKLYNGAVNYDSPALGDHYFNFTYGDVAFFVMDTRRYRSDPETVNNTATFKFIVSSVPFTSLWGHDAVKDSWGGYEVEKTQILQDLHSVPNVFILSGDRHEFAAIEFTGESEGSYPVQEISTSPLNMFYIPFVRTLKLQSEDVVQRTRTEVTLTEDGPQVETFDEEIPREKVLEYIARGTVKWSSIEVDTTNKTRPLLRLETWIDGRVAYQAETVGSPVKFASKALTYVPSSIKQLLEKIGFQSKQWF
ncbi:hypothetical protein EST38_g7754 [Candolleomyces aberdarensis]|uniref:PhoD-like phosphatase metallophosphatase domain-containing protein n=1 Tax=Candolleomyces aberdarensis TaxID=2316362 RepID=A0A4Q2DEV8_9AGAR|nr:hypothetical protein EST38_g7754 [Candolleomyces aberdarensis]